MQEGLARTARLVFLDKRAIFWFVFVLSVFGAIGLVDTGVVLLPGHTCAPEAWPSHSAKVLYIFDKTHGRWEECH
jgi:hypothetical protein